MEDNLAQLVASLTPVVLRGGVAEILCDEP
jgi:hypothetical protein